MSAAAWEDLDREEGALTAVSGESDGWYSVGMSNGWSCGISAEYGVEPKVGDSFVTWGSIGYPMRGQAINGQVLYYRTQDEQRQKDAWAATVARAERAANYETSRTEMDARVAALPALLRARVEGFRDRGGDQWRWEFESYELMCCEEVAKLLVRFPRIAQLKAFAKLKSHAAQKRRFPDMSDGHSGNSWGFTVRMAHIALIQPEHVAQMHGALCPMVGCADYHCWSTLTPSTPASGLVEGRE